MTTITGVPTTGSAPARSPIRRRITIAAAVTAVAAGGVAAVVTVGGDRDAGSRPEVSAAGAVLLRAADNVKPEPKVGPGQYRYVGQAGWNTSSGGMAESNELLYVIRYERMTETWAPADPTEEWLERRTTTGKLEWLEGDQEEHGDLARRDLPKGGERQATCGDFYRGSGPVDMCAGGWEAPRPKWVAKLPKDPKSLLEQLRKDVTWRPGGRTRDDLAFEKAMHALSSGMLPAKVRATLYRALALMPAIEITKDEVSLDGRRGTALGMKSLGLTRTDLIVNRETGEFIGVRTIVLRDFGGLEKGDVKEDSANVTAVVDEMGQLPPK